MTPGHKRKKFEIPKVNESGSEVVVILMVDLEVPTTIFNANIKFYTSTK